jgi:aryl-alcohol dehydrogenase-like predicted oxidoreductase
MARLEPPLSTSANHEATARYGAKFPELQKAGFYRSFNGPSVSSLGLGTYLGNPNEADDKLYVEAIKAALTSGINLLDSAINYRCMRSERNIGQALKELAAEGKTAREETVICTKGGFIPFDGGMPADPAGYFHKSYVATGICQEEDIVAGCHCMTPRYLRDQVERSLKNLGIGTLDLFYIHNPETQFEEVEPQEFYFRLEAAFRELEALVKEGKIAAYGTATWNGYRVTPGAPGFLSLAEVLRAAEKAGGSSHHFRAVQLPYNMAWRRLMDWRTRSWVPRPCPSWKRPRPTASRSSPVLPFFSPACRATSPRPWPRLSRGWLPTPKGPSSSSAPRPGSPRPW